MWEPAFVCLTVSKITKNVKNYWKDFFWNSQEMFKMENFPDLNSGGTLTFDLSKQGGFDQTATHYVAHRCIPTACLHAILVVCHYMWGNVLFGGLGSEGLFPRYFIIGYAIFIVFSSQVTFRFIEKFSPLNSTQRQRCRRGTKADVVVAWLGSMQRSWH